MNWMMLSGVVSPINLEMVCWHFSIDSYHLVWTRWYSGDIRTRFVSWLVLWFSRSSCSIWLYFCWSHSFCTWLNSSSIKTFAYKLLYTYIYSSRGTSSGDTRWLRVNTRRPLWGRLTSTVILIVFLLLQFVSAWFPLFFTVQLVFCVDDTWFDRYHLTRRSHYFLNHHNTFV